VYDAGFADTQADYEDTVETVFEAPHDRDKLGGEVPEPVA